MTHVLSCKKVRNYKACKHCGYTVYNIFTMFKCVIRKIVSLQRKIVQLTPTVSGQSRGGREMEKAPSSLCPFLSFSKPMRWGWDGGGG